MTNPLDDLLTGGGGAVNQAFIELLLPSDAGDADPRIYLGPNDPIAQALGLNAAIIFYFGNNRCFILGLENTGTPDLGVLHLWTYDEIVGLKRVLDVTKFVDAVGPVTTSWFPAADKYNDVLWFGQSMGRGIASGDSTTVSSGAVAAETVTLLTPSITWTANRVYRASYTCGVNNSVAAGLVQLRLRKNNVAGQDLGEFFRIPCPVAATQFAAGGFRLFGPINNDVTCAVAMTMAGTGGNAQMFATAASPRTLMIEDVGEVLDYTGNGILVTTLV